jgi:hypothetical protein
MTLEENKAYNERITKLLLTKDIVANAPRFLYNWTVGLVATRKPYVWSETPINLGHVIDVINRVHAHEILVNGVFNGDPHPGNILLCPDGRVGLIDYGQVLECSQHSGTCLADAWTLTARVVRSGCPRCSGEAH